MPDASFAEYTDRNSVTGGTGTVDLAYRAPGSKTEIVVGEIKPANLMGLQEGEIQVDNYLDKANANEGLMRRLGATEFRRLDPAGTEPPLPLVWWQGRCFQLRWCRAGLLFYKEVRRRREERQEE